MFTNQPIDGNKSAKKAPPIPRNMPLKFPVMSASRHPPSTAPCQLTNNESILERLNHPTQIERFKKHNLENTGKLQVNGKIYNFSSDDLIDEGEIGRGAYGTVNKVYHSASDTLMAVKKIRSTVDEKEQSQLLMDLQVVMKSNDCTFIVRFFGALFKEGDCWICMELMSISLDKFYKCCHLQLQQAIPEDILGRITVATLKALNYLKENLKIIHRDVKPSNILLDQSGNIKLCDFGISGQLVDSIAKTRDAGCRPYMAPERIDPKNFGKGYDVRSDVWSLGITLIEVATGRFPYPKWNSVFDQLTQVIEGDPPRLTSSPDAIFSTEFVDFVNTCLIKDVESRPKYNTLLEHRFVQRYARVGVDVQAYVTHVLNRVTPDQLEAFNNV